MMLEDNLKKIKLQILQLIKQINYHNNLYYNLSVPEISDGEYDLLIRDLIKFEVNYPQFKFDFSPTQKVGFTVADKFEKIAHSHPMLSLSNAFSLKELHAFFKRANKIVANKFTFVCEPKIDGIGISIIYKNGLFQQAITRGNGVIGEDVTANVRTIKNLPLKITYQKQLEIRGEIFFNKAQFASFNKKMHYKFKNPRNAAGGSLRNLNSAIVALRPLQVVFYYIVDPFSHNLHLQSDCLKFLEKNLLPVSIYNKLCDNLHEVENYINTMLEDKKNLLYVTDGVVIKINELDYYHDLGQTNKFPRSATAYKFPSQIKLTKLLDIVPTIGRSGKITLNAVLEPVDLDGSVVSKATLHNIDYVRDHDIRINDEVYVYKSGDIIPCITNSAVHKRVGTEFIFRLNLICPSCQSPLVKLDNQVDYFCINTNCPSRIINSLLHFVSIEGVNIKELGEKTLKAFYQAKIVTTIQDIFLLKNQETVILKINKFGKKSFLNLVNAIEFAAKNCNLKRILYALGIAHAGSKTCEILSQEFFDIKAIECATVEQLTAINSFGKKIANAIYQFMHNKSNLFLLDDLLKFGVNFQNNSKIVVTSDKLKNCVFVITGTLSQARLFYSNLITTNGGKLVNSLSKKTTHLLTGKNPGSKVQKVTNLNIKIINEEQFFNLI